MSRAEAAAMLGVPQDADRATAQRAYLRLARQVHPDSAPDAPDAAERFGDLSRARAVFDSPPPDAPPSGPSPETAPRPGVGRLMHQPSASVGDAMLVLVLLVFLLVALVTLDSAIRTGGFEQGSPAGATVSTTA